MAEEPTSTIRVELVDEAAPPAPTGPARGWQEHPAPDARRPVVPIAIAAVVVAGVLGIAVGRASTGPDPLRPSAAPSTAVDRASPTTVARSGSTSVAETIPPVTEAATPAAREGSSTVAADTVDAVGPAAITTTSVELDPRLAGAELRIVAPRQDGRWARLDLRDGRVDELADADPSQFLTDQAVIAGEGWIAYGRATEPAALWRDDRRAWSELPRVAPAPFLREADTDRFWVERATVGPATTFELVGFDGTTAGGSIDVPAGATVVGSDPVGGLLVRGGARLFRLTPDEQAGVATGDLLAANAAVIVTWSCDAAFACAVEVTDRTTGDVRTVAVDGDAGSSLAPVPRPDVIAASDLSWPLTVDGGHLAVTSVGETGFALGSLDLATGDLRPVSEHSRPVPAVWTPDGRYLLHVASGVPYAFDRTTGETFAIAPGGQFSGWNGVVAVR